MRIQIQLPLPATYYNSFDHPNNHKRGASQLQTITLSTHQINGQCTRSDCYDQNKQFFASGVSFGLVSLVLLIQQQFSVYWFFPSFFLIIATVTLLVWYFWYSDTQFCQPFSEKLNKFRVFEVFIQTILGVLAFYLWGIVPATITALITGHKGNSSDEQTPHIPRRCPALLMVVSEGCADRHIQLKSPIFCVEEQFGCCKWEPVIVTPLILRIQPMDNKVKVQVAIPGNKYPGYWFFFELMLLLVEASNGQLL